MEQSPSGEANRFSDSQEIPRILWKLNVHYRIHKCRPPVPILNQMDHYYTVTLLHSCNSATELYFLVNVSVIQDI